MLYLQRKRLVGDSSKWRTVCVFDVVDADVVLKSTDALARKSDMGIMRLTRQEDSFEVVGVWSYDLGWTFF
jgi:hypothetical protein